MSHRKLLALALTLTAIPAIAVAPGATVPDFKGTDSNGAQHTLSEYRGKYVVLEWANKGCPFDQKHYLSGSMENLQKEWTARGVVWLSIISSAPGEQGVTPAEENTYLKTMHAAPTAVLLDPRRLHRPPLRSQNHPTHLRHRPHRQAHLRRCHRQQTHHRPGRPEGRAKLPERRPERGHGWQARSRREHPPLRLQRQIRPLAPRKAAETN